MASHIAPDDLALKHVEDIEECRIALALPAMGQIHDIDRFDSELRHSVRVRVLPDVIGFAYASKSSNE